MGEGKYGNKRQALRSDQGLVCMEGEETMRCPWQKRNKTKPQWHVLHINEAITPGESDILAELKTVKEELTKLRDLIVKEKAQ